MWPPTELPRAPRFMLTLAFCSYGLLAAGSLPPTPTAPLGGAPPSQGKGGTGHPHGVEEPGDGIPAQEHTPCGLGTSTAQRGAAVPLEELILRACL